MDHVKMLKEIMKSSGWTQEQLAGKLGVSFATINSWLNGRTKPREGVYRGIEKLYLAQDLTGEAVPVYVTIVGVDKEVRVGDNVLLERAEDNDYDDEAIEARLIDGEDTFEDAEVSLRINGAIRIGDEEKQIKLNKTVQKAFDKDVQIIDGDNEENADAVRCTVTCRECCMYVANSVSTVVRGTYSAGRIYDKFEGVARAQILFIHHGRAIARIVEWDAKEK